MKDIQNEKPENEIELNRVGVEGLRKYVVVKRPKKNYHTIVTVNSYIKLPSNLRGANMSRFAESIEEIPEETPSIEDLAQKISVTSLAKHNFNCCTRVFCEFPFERTRPNGTKECGIAKLFAEYSTETKRKTLGISLNGALACPCSKEMCGGLTHNQRGNLRVKIDVSESNIEVTDILNICTESFSAPTFSILKRPEEKKLVEKMHENARFVEDVVRKCVQSLRQKYPNRYCSVKCVSFESIHDHNASSEWRGNL
ncbi:MAG: GTP cyclohydrolase I FolE2 [Candidatus Bathyarchaeota archaeon]|nr:GTP cyclohydrolase I FolE2 [Candidatus Bathyarchaeota archaeon]